MELHWRLDDKRFGYELPNEEGSIIIGRADSCDVVIKDETVSRRHIEIMAQGELYQLMSLKQDNVVYHNGVPLMQYQTVPLQSGDRIRVGAVEIAIGHQIGTGDGGRETLCHGCHRFVDVSHDYCPWCGFLISG